MSDRHKYFTCIWTNGLKVNFREKITAGRGIKKWNHDADIEDDLNDLEAGQALTYTETYRLGFQAWGLHAQEIDSEAGQPLTCTEACKALTCTEVYFLRARRLGILQLSMKFLIWGTYLFLCA